MPDYYIPDRTARPYSDIFGDKATFPFPLNIVFGLRKAIGWQETPRFAISLESLLRPLAISDLPLSLREDFQGRIRESEECGFKTIFINKTDTLGTIVNYASLHCSVDQKTLLRISAMGIAIGKFSQGEWVSALRTELQDGTVLLTNTKVLPAFMTLPNYQIESLPGRTPLAELCRVHSVRINSIPEEQIVQIPQEEIVPFLKTRAEAELQERLARGHTRKLTEKEAEKLRKVEFDF